MPSSIVSSGLGGSSTLLNMQVHACVVGLQHIHNIYFILRRRFSCLGNLCRTHLICITTLSSPIKYSFQCTNSTPPSSQSPKYHKKSPLNMNEALLVVIFFPVIPGFHSVCLLLPYAWSIKYCCCSSVNLYKQTIARTLMKYLFSIKRSRNSYFSRYSLRLWGMWFFQCWWRSSLTWNFLWLMIAMFT